MRFVIAFLFLANTSAEARCIDYKGRPCRLRATMLSAEYLRAPDLAELHATMLRVDVRRDADSAGGWGLECARLDLIDVTPDGNVPELEVAGSGLGVRFFIDRTEWSATLGVHAVTMVNGDIRYLTPSAALRMGALTIGWRSLGLYAGSAGDGVPARSFRRDFEIDGRATTGALSVRGRFRDVDTGKHHIRDAMLAVGVELRTRRGFYDSMPSFVGIGMRRELARVSDAPAGVIERRVEPPGPTWQLLAWLELDLGLEHRGR